VNYVLARRLELLGEVGRLQESLGVPGDVSYTCETAGHFYLYQVTQLTPVSLAPAHSWFI
jgi:intron-binding protein aquarius